MFRMIALMIMAVFAASPAAAASSAPAPNHHIFGQWHAGIDATGIYAYTENESGAQFGLACIDGQCAYYLYTRAGCMLGQKYDLLLSNLAAGDPVKMYGLTPRAICNRGNDANIRMLYFVDRDMPLLTAGSEIAIAVPGEDTQFRVSKFSLDGASAAIAWTVQAVMSGGRQTAAPKQSAQ